MAKTSEGLTINLSSLSAASMAKGQALSASRYAVAAGRTRPTRSKAWPRHIFILGVRCLPESENVWKLINWLQENWSFLMDTSVIGKCVQKHFNK